MTVFPTRNRTVPAVTIPAARLVGAGALVTRRNVPAHLEVVRIDAAARARRLADNDVTQYLMAESTTLVVSPTMDDGSPMPDGVVLVSEAMSTGRISPSTLASYDPRAQTVLVVDGLTRARALDKSRGAWLPVCTPMSPTGAQHLVRLIEPIERVPSLPATQMDIEEVARAFVADALGLWRDCVRSLQDGADFVSSLVPPGTRARGAERLSHLSASHLLAQTRDPRELAGWVNAATSAHAYAKAAFREYVGM